MFENYIDSNGVEIWTTQTGEGYPLILCNGGAGCCGYLAPVAEMVDDLVKVIRFEQRWCGRSQHVPPYDIEICLIDFENIRKSYRTGGSSHARGAL